MLNGNFVIVGAVIQILGGLTYVFGTVRGTIQPNKITWLMWTLAPLVAFAAEVAQGVGIVALTTFSSALVPLLVFTASFFNQRAQWRLGRFDVACGVLSFLGIVLWYITKVGNVAIVFAIAADGFAAVPTIVKSYHEPETENELEYACGIMNALIALLVIRVWDFQNYGFPVYLLVVQIVLVVLIRFKVGKIASKTNS